MRKTTTFNAQKCQITSGRSYPLGATFDGKGTNFALFSANAEKVELCIFDESGQTEIKRIALAEFTDEIWHGYIEGLPVGTLYGYRVHGVFEPHNGHRFNASKLLIDPYAKNLKGNYVHSDTHYGYQQYANYDQSLGEYQHDLTIDTRDNASFLPKCVVTEPLPTCHSHPQVRRRDTLLYEMHVKGFTKNHPDVPVDLQGSFAGLAQDAICQYVKDLGITSIELLPVHTFLDEPFIQEKGLKNYWGYNSLAFFIPEPSYSQSGEISEFKTLVDKYHQHGIEVILDVVYNHTAEGDHLGPTICFKGIDNASYYRLNNDDKRFYINHSGCGNSLNIQHPRVLQLVTDSLRYWVETMGIDGFRFDLAPILGRTEQGFSSASHFFSALRQDPVLSRIKLIAEPWDIGEDGYQLGNFPNSWLEWNDKFRDTARRFWRGDHAMAPEFAKRLHGSSDLFENPGRRPSSSINFITSHDGYTLHDLVSYEHRHNQANGEHSQDGHGSNFSHNFGVEGETANSTINQLRLRQKRNLLTTLFVAQGTPMLMAGDEMGNSQQGNNNAYCQDNDISWLSWQEPMAEQQQAFVKQLIALRKAHPLLNRTHYHHGEEYSNKTGLADISWLNCCGKTMQEDDWHDKEIRCFAMLLAETNDRTNGTNNDDALLIIFNAHQCEINYSLPAFIDNKENTTMVKEHWQVLINTATFDQESQQSNNTNKLTHSALCVAAHSCVVLAYSQTNFE